jgi:rRNA processing protein Krr1/Pno1
MIPQRFVGWIKGSSGAQIKNLEARTGTTISINQDSKEMGYSLAVVNGPAEQVGRCIQLIEDEIRKMETRDTSIATKTMQGGAWEIRIPQPYVGWIKGPQGAQIRDIEKRSGAHVNIDQTTQAQGYSRALLYGEHDQVQMAAAMIQKELDKVSPKDVGSTALSIPAVAPDADFTQKREQLLSLLMTLGGGGAAPALASGAPANVPSQFDTLNIPTGVVGWVKGRQGAMIREIENRSGAQVSIDQQHKDMGYCTVEFRGGVDQKRRAYGFVVGEIMKAADTPHGEPIEVGDIGFKDEIHLDSQYVGWVKGPSGKMIQEMSTKSATRIDVDQTQSASMGHALVKIYGTFDGIQEAKRLLAAELHKVSPEAAQQILVTVVSTPQNDSSSSLGGSFNVGGAGASACAHTAHAPALTHDTGPALQPLPVGTGPHDVVRIPNGCVGWLKGRQGAMIRDIEGKSGATVEIDQNMKDTGHSFVYMRGTEEQKKIAHGFVVAEITKAVDAGGPCGEPLDPSMFYHEDVRLDARYVGWIKGPKGKIISDICLSSCCRVDIDQSEKASGFAMVKIYGTAQGVADAKQMIASELSKVAPDSAQDFVGGVELTGKFAARTTRPETSLPQVVHPEAVMAMPVAPQPAMTFGHPLAQSLPQPLDAYALQQQVNQQQALINQLLAMQQQPAGLQLGALQAPGGLIQQAFITQQHGFM